MNASEFLAFYPQFNHFQPEAVLSEYLRQANARFGDFGDDAPEARRLYLAHKLTLYAFTALPEGTEASAALLASSGKAQTASRIASKKVGEVQVTYAAGSSSTARASTGLADLTETEYGLQLLTLLRQHIRPRYLC